MYSGALHKGDKLVFIPKGDPSKFKVVVVKWVRADYVKFHYCFKTKEGFPEYADETYGNIGYGTVISGKLASKAKSPVSSEYYAEVAYSVDEFLTSKELLSQISPCPKFLSEIRNSL